MKCSIEAHQIGVNFDYDYECKVCRYLFVSTSRFDQRYCILTSEIPKHLKLKFDVFWKVEQAKLVALRGVVKKIKHTRTTKDTSKLFLDEDTVYVWEDFEDLNIKLIPSHELRIARK